MYVGLIMIVQDDLFCQARNAEDFGAAGLILYSDPADSAPKGVSSVYPESWWLPPTGVERGNVKLLKGDLLTPGYPAIGEYSVIFVPKCGILPPPPPDQ